jgi:hypothetical protein
VAAAGRFCSDSQVLLLLLPLSAASSSTDESILQIQLLKRHRKSNYKDGCTAAGTFWFSLFAGAKGADRLPLTHPPTKYYSTACEEA